MFQCVSEAQDNKSTLHQSHGNKYSLALKMKHLKVMYDSLPAWLCYQYQEVELHSLRPFSSGQRHPWIFVPSPTTIVEIPSINYCRVKKSNKITQQIK